METTPFRYSPDSFWISLAQRPAGFELRLHATPFGPSDEMLCYFDGTLIGLVVDQGGANGLRVSLLPKLDGNRPYAWPTAEQFQKALCGLLHLTTGWSLRSERDTDQIPVPVLRSKEVLREELSVLVQYCLGAAVACPTFQAHGEGLDVHPSLQRTASPSAELAR